MKLKKSEKQSLGGLFTVAYLSGLVLLVFSRWIRVPTPIGEQRHPAEPWIRLLHSGTTYVILVALGYLVKGHILPGLRSKKRLGTGLTLLCVLAGLAVSALCILYGGESGWVSYAAVVHWSLGLATPLLLLVHLFSAKAKRLSVVNPLTSADPARSDYGR